jgi:hypothetical protein
MYGVRRAHGHASAPVALTSPSSREFGACLLGSSEQSAGIVRCRDLSFPAIALVDGDAVNLLGSWLRREFPPGIPLIQCIKSPHGPFRDDLVRLPRFGGAFFFIL